LTSFTLAIVATRVSFVMLPFSTKCGENDLLLVMMNRHTWRRKTRHISELLRDPPNQPRVMIHVIATIELNPGTRESFLTEFRKLVPFVRAEEGCLEYGATIDVASGLAVQPPIRENTVTVVEKWSDLAALKAHLQAPHMNDYRPRVKDYVASVRLDVLQPAHD
jgi:quinol monooxygenase YgiN